MTDNKITIKNKKIATHSHVGELNMYSNSYVHKFAHIYLSTETINAFEIYWFVIEKISS